MKKCIVAMAFAFVSAAMAGEGVLPVIKIGEGGGEMAVSTRVYEGFAWNSKSRDAAWSMSRLVVEGIQPNGPLVFHFDFSSECEGQRDENWLREAWVGYKVDSTCEVHVGRIFTYGDITPPPWAALAYPRFLLPNYGWGVQVMKGLPGGFTFYGDLTAGDLDNAFDNQKSFRWSHPVLGLRLDKDTGAVGPFKSLVLGAETQLSCDRRICATNATLAANDKLSLVWQLYVDQKQDEHRLLGSWFSADYVINKWIRPYILLDWQEQERTILRAGVELRPPGVLRDRCRLILSLQSDGMSFINFGFNF